MRKALGALGVIAALAAALAGPALLWRWRPSRALDVVVLDKTVPFRNFREHETFTWLLHALKITDRRGRYAVASRDYVGHDPVARVGHDLTEARLQGASMLFIADTYGVYVDDYTRPGDVAHMERSSLRYGGIEEAEAHAIEGFARRGGTVVGEFNSFASPTREPARATMEGVFGVRWTHWVGRYWVDLQDPNEVPRWVGEVYARLYHRPFDFRGPGFVFVREDADMVVLQPGVHLGPDVLTIARTAEAPDLVGWPARGAFRYWLDVVAPARCDVVYAYHVDATAEGLRALAAHGIPSVFPALTRRRDGPRAWYFAGDFVDNATPRGDPERAGVLTWRRLAPASDDDPDGTFLWRWYVPIMERILAGVQ
jgi:hypothetical protein